MQLPKSALAPKPIPHRFQKISAAPALAAVSGTKRMASSAIPFSSIPNIDYRHRILPLPLSEIITVFASTRTVPPRRKSNRCKTLRRYCSQGPHPSLCATHGSRSHERCPAERNRQFFSLHTASAFNVAHADAPCDLPRSPVPLPSGRPALLLFREAKSLAG